MSKILVIEDDATILEGINDTLRFHGYSVLEALNGQEGLKIAQKEHPDLIILDIMLPDHDGFEILKKIRETDREIPIIMLTARSQESDKLLGFELGADDYVTKPFSVKVLMARIKAVLKRSGSRKSQEKELVIGDAVINLKNFEIHKKGETFQLSPKECHILKLLVQHPEEVITRERIIDEVWGEDYFPSPRTIDNFILKLRTKIEDDPRNPDHILTVHGAGYKLKMTTL